MMTKAIAAIRTTAHWIFLMALAMGLTAGVLTALLNETNFLAWTGQSTYNYGASITVLGMLIALFTVPFGGVRG